MGALGVIGGSGIYKLEELRHGTAFDVDTPFGRPSGPVHQVRIGKTDLLFLPRHGVGHVYSPTTVPYRANIHALKQLGATHLLSLSAVGSLREDLPPRTLLLPDQIIDRTVHRDHSFFDQGVVAHVGIADPFCPHLQSSVIVAAGVAGQQTSRGGAYLCIEGPQFSTRAESNMYRSWDATVIGMTAMPEARLAREAELCFAMLAMVTDYDVWHDSEVDVTVEVVNSHLQANSQSAASIVRALAEAGLQDRTCACGSALDSALVSSPQHVSAAARERIRLLAGDRLNEI